MIDGRRGFEEQFSMSAAIRSLTADLGGTFRLDVRWRDAQGNPLNLASGTAALTLWERSTDTTALHTYAATTTADGWLRVAIPPAEVATWPDRCSYRLAYTGVGTDVLLVGPLRKRGPDDV